MAEAAEQACATPDRMEELQRFRSPSDTDAVSTAEQNPPDDTSDAPGPAGDAEGRGEGGGGEGAAEESPLGDERPRNNSRVRFESTELRGDRLSKKPAIRRASSAPISLNAMSPVGDGSNARELRARRRADQKVQKLLGAHTSPEAYTCSALGRADDSLDLIPLQIGMSTSRPRKSSQDRSRP